MRFGSPERGDQIACRVVKGSAGGLPPTFDPEVYKQHSSPGPGQRRPRDSVCARARFLVQTHNQPQCVDVDEGNVEWHFEQW